MAVRVPQGRHILLLRFEDTPVRRAGKALSAAAVLAVLLLGAARLLLRRGGAR
jgi:hypothetical protein